MAKRGRPSKGPRKVKLNELVAAIDDELELYHADIIAKTNAAGEKAVKTLVKKTKATAPEGITGEYKKRITWTAVPWLNGSKRFIWHVKAPDYRLTHLLVHGHVTSKGNRTRKSPFLQNALDSTLPEYEREVEEAITND